MHALLCLAVKLTLVKYATPAHRVCLTSSAGPVMQVAVCLAATKVALISASQHNTSKPCEQAHHVQCGSAAARMQLLLTVAEMPAFCNADVQAREMVAAGSCRRLLSDPETYCRHDHGLGAMHLGREQAAALGTPRLPSVRGRRAPA